MHRICLVLVLAIITAGCANLNSIHREFDTAKGKSQLIDIRQRAILVAPAPGDTVTNGTDETKVRICAEPSPDAMASLALQLAMEGSYKGTGAKAAMAMQESAAFVGLRTQSIQLLRDYGYRLCESYMNGAINEAQYDILLRRYQKNTAALLAIEALTGTIKAPNLVLTSQGMAEAATSLSDLRAESDKISSKINEIKKDIDAKKAEKTATTDEKAVAALDAQIAAATANLARLEGDKATIESAITNARGVLSEGKTDVVVITSGMPSQRTDEHIQAISDTVKEIVNNIILSDDQTQICLSMLQSTNANAEIKPGSPWYFCKQHLENNVKERNLQLGIFENTMKNSQIMLYESQEKPAKPQGSGSTPSKPVLPNFPGNHIFMLTPRI